MWMSGKPTDPGFYWHRNGPDDTIPTVILLDQTGVVRFLGDDDTVACNEPLKGEYIGPIQPPVG